MPSSFIEIIEDYRYYNQTADYAYDQPQLEGEVVAEGEYYPETAEAYTEEVVVTAEVIPENVTNEPEQQQKNKKQNSNEWNLAE